MTVLDSPLSDNALYDLEGAVYDTLKVTPMSEGIHAGLGFRDLGRFLEYAAA